MASAPIKADRWATALEACIVTCPWHGWQFDVRTGQNQLNERIVQPRFDARVEGEWILVDLG